MSRKLFKNRMMVVFRIVIILPVLLSVSCTRPENTTVVSETAMMPTSVPVELNIVATSIPAAMTASPAPTSVPTPVPTEIPEPADVATAEPVKTPKPTKTPDPIKTPKPTKTPKGMTPSPDETPTPTPKPAYYLNWSEKEIYGGGVAQLISYSYSDDNEVKTTTWKTSDKKIAIVDEYGVVIGLRKGTVKITATANNGSGKKSTCMITVTSDRPQPKDKVSIEKYCYVGNKKLSESESRKVKKLCDSLGTEHSGEMIAAAALRYVGYNYGTKEGNIDCSMMALYTCLDRNISISRRADWQAKDLKKYEVKPENLKAGDFMFFAYPENVVCTCSTAPMCKRYMRIHHVAVYIGEIDGKKYVAEASSDVGKVCVRRWDGTENHAGMKLVFCGRPSKLR